MGETSVRVMGSSLVLVAARVGEMRVGVTGRGSVSVKGSVLVGRNIIVHSAPLVVGFSQKGRR